MRPTTPPSDARRLLPWAVVIDLVAMVWCTAIASACIWSLLQLFAGVFPAVARVAIATSGWHWFGALWAVLILRLMLRVMGLVADELLRKLYNRHGGAE